MNTRKRWILAATCCIGIGAAVAIGVRTGQPPITPITTPSAQVESRVRDLYRGFGSDDALAAHRTSARVVDGGPTTLVAFLDAKHPQRIPGDFSSRLPRVDGDAQTAAVLAVLADRDEDTAVRHEAVNLLRRSGYAGLDPVLVALLMDDGESALIRSYAAQHLAINLVDRFPIVGCDRAAVLWAAFGDPERTVRREALLGLARSGDDSMVALLRAGTSERLRGMEDLVLQTWQDQGWQELRPRVPAYLAHADERVILAAISLVGTWRIAEQRDAVAALVGTRSPRVDRAAHLVLDRLATVN